MFGVILWQWCREAFKEKEARLKAFHEGPRTFGLDGLDGLHTGVQGTEIMRDEDESFSRRSGLMALVFFLALLLLVLVYGGKVFAWYAVLACCVCTVATALGGWDTIELWWSMFSWDTPAELKQD